MNVQPESQKQGVNGVLKECELFDIDQFLSPTGEAKLTEQGWMTSLSLGPSVNIDSMLRKCPLCLPALCLSSLQRLFQLKLAKPASLFSCVQ